MALDANPHVVMLNDAVLAERLGCKPIVFGRDGKPMPPPNKKPNILGLTGTVWWYWPIIEGAEDNGA